MTLDRCRAGSLRRIGRKHAGRVPRFALRSVRVLAALGGTVLLTPSRVVLAADCTDPVAINPVPAIRGHVDFPVEYRATVNRRCGLQGATYLWQKIAGPVEFDIDGAGGLFYWTPAQTGNPTITIKVSEFWPSAPTQTDTETFTPAVDDNTMTQPLFRDYRSEATTVDIRGRAHGTDFVSYTLEYAEASNPVVKFPIAGPITTCTWPRCDWSHAGSPGLVASNGRAVVLQRQGSYLLPARGVREILGDERGRACADESLANPRPAPVLGRRS